MKTELDVLKDVVHKLDKLNIAYMLTGSLAMSYYAIPRMTRDIDIVIELNSMNAEKFISSFKNDYYVSEESVIESIEKEFIFNIIHYESSIKIDFIQRKSSIYRNNEFERRKKIRVSDFNIFIVSGEDLIISKLFWYKDSESELQKKDILSLLSSEYDQAYLNEWIGKLNLTEIYERVIK